jgi:Holliday junction resolvasome RuvABC endonuclease subunit
LTFWSHGTDPGSRHCGQALLCRNEHGWWLDSHSSIVPRKGESASDRMTRILRGYNLLTCHVHCFCFELQTGGSIGGQAAGKWQAGNLSVHEVVGAIKMAALERRVPCLGLATSSIVKAVTGSGVIRGGVNYEVLERVLRLQVKGIPERVSEHVLMACAVAIAGARVNGGRTVENRWSTLPDPRQVKAPGSSGTNYVKAAASIPQRGHSNRVRRET